MQLGCHLGTKVLVKGYGNIGHKRFYNLAQGFKGLLSMKIRFCEQLH